MAQIQTQNPGPDAEAGGDSIFFNVMPEPGKGFKAQAPVVLSDEHLANRSSGSGLKTLLKVLLVLVLIGTLGGGGYYAWQNGYLTKVTELLKKEPKEAQQNPESLPQTLSTTPGEWLLKYWGSQTCEVESICSDSADPDRDGLTNLAEYQKATDPNNADSDQDGLADGDEIQIFLTDPLNPRTASNPKYTDGDYMNGGYDIAFQSQLMTAEQRAEVSGRMREFGLHQPTLTTISGGLGKALYDFAAQPEASSTPDTAASPATTTPAATTSTSSSAQAGVDVSPEAKQDRDTRRSTTIKNISIALLKYRDNQGKLPTAGTFEELFSAVKPFLKVATNPHDPINQDPFVYGYQVLQDGQDFQLSYMSETQDQLIKIKAAQAEKYRTAEEADMLDEQRRTDLDTLRGALLVYSSQHVAGNQTYVFPTTERYKTELVPTYISAIPKDPQTKQDYRYEVSATFDTFTLKATLSNPSPGTTGYLCNQDECRAY